MAKAKMGIWYEIPNTNRRNAENDEYMAIKVENESGTNERWLMFTKREWEKLPIVQLYSPGAEKLQMKKGRLYSCCKNGKNQFIMNTDKGAIMLITHYKLEIAEARAIRNQEDKPKQNWLDDILD